MDGWGVEGDTAGWTAFGTGEALEATKTMERATGRREGKARNSGDTRYNGKSAKLWLRSCEERIGLDQGGSSTITRALQTHG